MSNPNSDVEKLQLSLAGAALSLLDCEQRANADSMQPYQIAKMLGYHGDFEPIDNVRAFLAGFFNQTRQR
jgi:hypothetical protein